MTLRKYEINALLYARREVVAGRRCICPLLSAWEGSTRTDLRHLYREISELIDQALTVEDWLDCSREMAKTYRLAIIDTLLARRGVKVVGGKVVPL